MRVLHVIHNLKREGAQTMVVNLATALDPEFTQAVIFPWRESGPYEHRLKQAKVPVIQPVSGTAPPLRTVVALRRVVREESIDVVHAHMSDSAILVALALAGTDVPFVVTHHSNRLLPKEGWAKHFLRRISSAWALRRAAFNIGVTPNVADQLKEEFSLPPDKVIHITNGVRIPPQAAVDAAHTARLENEERKKPWPRITTLGRLAPVKRQDIAIDAIHYLRDILPELSLRILGEGPLKPELADQIERRDLSSFVNLPGPTDDVADALRNTDIYVSTSAYEGLPVAVLEAMSWSLPVIATEVPGHRDVIHNGVDGCLVPFNNPQALAQEILRLCTAATERAGLGRAARERAVNDFSDTKMAAEYCETYRAGLKLSTRGKLIALTPIGRTHRR
nr:glycosyltransferase [Microvirga terrestris]